MARESTRMTPVERGRRIKALREARNLTQEDVARAVGVRARAVSAWERGERKDVSSTHLAQMAKIFGTTVDYILGLSSDA